MQYIGGCGPMLISSSTKWLTKIHLSQEDGKWKATWKPTNGYHPKDCPSFVFSAATPVEAYATTMAEASNYLLCIFWQPPRTYNGRYKPAHLALLDAITLQAKRDRNGN